MSTTRLQRWSLTMLNYQYCLRYKYCLRNYASIHRACACGNYVSSVAENFFQTQAKEACVSGSYAGHFSLTQATYTLAYYRKYIFDVYFYHKKTVFTEEVEI